MSRDAGISRTRRGRGAAAAAARPYRRRRVAAAARLYRRRRVAAAARLYRRRRVETPPRPPRGSDHGGGPRPRASQVRRSRLLLLRGPVGQPALRRGAREEARAAREQIAARGLPRPRKSAARPAPVVRRPRGRHAVAEGTTDDLRQPAAAGAHGRRRHALGPGPVAAAARRIGFGAPNFAQESADVVRRSARHVFS